MQNTKKKSPHAPPKSIHKSTTSYNVFKEKDCKHNFGVNCDSKMAPTFAPGTPGRPGGPGNPGGP